MFRIHLFGSLHFSNDDGRIDFQIRPSTSRLLALLLLTKGPLKRQAAAFKLWRDDSEEIALGKLRRHLYRLRRALPTSGSQPWLFSDDSTIQWMANGSAWVDVQHFETLLRAGLGSAEAAELYQGDLLEEFDDDWVYCERERLRSLHVANLKQLVLDSRARRSLMQGVDYASRLLALEPWREDIIRQLIAMRYESGDRAGAIREFDSFRWRLRCEFKISPMPETNALYEEIERDTLRPDVRQTSQPQDQAGGGPASLPPLVGRETELERLRRCWTRALHGAGSAVFIEGESGIGKTRLAGELTAIAEAQGALVLRGSSSFPEVQAYQPIVEAIRNTRAVVAASDLLPVWRAVLAQIVPELRSEDMAVPTLVPVGREREESRLFEALAQCVEALSRRRPVLIVLEDIHWAGAATIAALEFLIRRLTTTRALLLVTLRYEEAASRNALLKARQKLLQGGIASRMEPSRLSHDSVASLVQHFASSVIDQQTTSRIHETSEGNPFFVLQLIGDLREALDSGISASESCNDFKLYDSVRPAVISRLSRISSAARSALEAASVIGAGFDLNVLKLVTGWPESEIRDAIGELIDRSLIREGASTGESDYVFTHHLFQSAVYAEQRTDRRQRRHFRVAQVLEDLDPTLASEIAHHYERSGERERAARHFLVAARTAFAVFANEEARAYATKSVALSPDSRARFEALALRETIEEHLGEVDSQEADLAALEEIARELRDPSLTCEALYRRIRFCHERGQRQLESRLLSELSDSAKNTPDAKWTARAFIARATYCIDVSQFDAARDALQSAATTDSIDDDVRVEILVLRLKIAAILSESNVYNQLLSAIEHIEETRGRAMRQIALQAIVAVHRATRNYSELLVGAQKLLSESQDAGDIRGEAGALSLLWHAETFLGRYEEALEHEKRAACLLQRLGDQDGLASLLKTKEQLLIRSGNVNAAVRCSRAALSIYESLENIYEQVNCLAGLAADLGQSDDKHDLMQGLAACWRALRLARSAKLEYLYMASLGNLSWFELILGKVLVAERHARGAIEYGRRIGDTRFEVAFTATLSLCLARQSRFEQAKSAIDLCLEYYDRCESQMIITHDLHFFAARIYRALSLSNESRVLLQKSYQKLMQLYQSLPREHRGSLLSMPLNRQIVAAHDRHEWNDLKAEQVAALA